MRNYYYLIIALMALFLAVPATAQEGDAPPPAKSADPVDDADQADQSDESEESGELDDSDLDEQTYEEDDDDFVPTEEIPADVPIPFPTNI